MIEFTNAMEERQRQIARDAGLVLIVPLMASVRTQSGETELALVPLSFDGERIQGEGYAMAAGTGTHAIVNGHRVRLEPFLVFSGGTLTLTIGGEPEAAAALWKVLQTVAPDSYSAEDRTLVLPDDLPPGVADISPERRLADPPSDVLKSTISSGGTVKIESFRIMDDDDVPTPEPDVPTPNDGKLETWKGPPPPRQSVDDEPPAKTWRDRPPQF